MRNLPRKAVVKYKPHEHKVKLTGVYNALALKSHKHVCENPSCRLLYQDNCFVPERNERCHSCKSLRRPWVYSDGLSSYDPRPCCVNNTELLTDPDSLLRFECAGPGPWFQCRDCKRCHGHPCTEDALLFRPYEVLPRKEDA